MNPTVTPTRREFLISPPQARLRLDQFLARELPELSRTRIQALIHKGLVSLNGKAVRPREILRAGDEIILTERPSAIASSHAQPGADHEALPILFEDADLIVIDKPTGLAVHRGAGQQGDTVVEALRGQGIGLSAIGGEDRPGIVHRLDKQTSGCLVVAKTEAAHMELARQFATRRVNKIYLALVAGKLRRNSGTIDAAIARHRVHRTKMAVAREGGREASTDYRLVRSGAAAGLVECRLHSGRTHQIRVHMQHLGHPILGDTVYAGRRAGKFPRQMLHAWKLGFDHPRTKQSVHFEAPLPEDFKATMKAVL